MVFMLKSLFIIMCYFCYTFKSFYIFILVLVTSCVCVRLVSLFGPTISGTGVEVDVLRQEVQVLRTELSVSISVKAISK
jgi:hypothetical protein